MSKQPEIAHLDPQQNPRLLAAIRSCSSPPLRQPTLTARVLGFHAGLDLVRVRDAAWPESTEMRLLRHRPTTAIGHLRGAGDEILAMNARLALKLHKPWVKPYLRFFCDHVHAQEGPFAIVEDAIDLACAWELGQGDPRGLADLIEPITVAGRSPRWIAQANVLYGTTLYLAEFAIHKHGMIQMTDYTNIASGLPLRPPVRLI